MSEYRMAAIFYVHLVDGVAPLVVARLRGAAAARNAARATLDLTPQNAPSRYGST
jgi:hypothetical protein